MCIVASIGRVSTLPLPISRRSRALSIWSATMTEPACLAYLSDPFSVREAAFRLVLPNGESHALTAAQVSAYDGPLVAYDLPALVDELRRGAHQPPRHPIDL